MGKRSGHLVRSAYTATCQLPPHRLPSPSAALQLADTWSVLVTAPTKEDNCTAAEHLSKYPQWPEAEDDYQGDGTHAHVRLHSTAIST
eukprot:scaffold24800_cov77-Skeletonema_dohrnii-CCMP3373.AAC.2